MHIRKKYTQHLHTYNIIYMTQRVYICSYDREPKIKYTTHTLQFKTKNSLSLPFTHANRLLNLHISFGLNLSCNGSIFSFLFALDNSCGFDTL